MFSFGQLKLICRRLAKAPVFTGVTLITLAFGVGANTAIFSVVESVVLKPLDYSHPDQLIGIGVNAPGIGLQKLGIGQFIYFIDREQNSTLQDLGVYASNSLDVTGDGEPEHVKGLGVSDGTLRILGVTPALGRLFSQQDDAPGSAGMVLLSYSYWQKKFGGNASAVGHSITVDGKPREIHSPSFFSNEVRNKVVLAWVTVAISKQQEQPNISHLRREVHNQNRSLHPAFFDDFFMDTSWRAGILSP